MENSIGKQASPTAFLVVLILTFGFVVGIFAHKLFLRVTQLQNDETAYEIARVISPDGQTAIIVERHNSADLPWRIFKLVDVTNGGDVV